MDSTLDNLADQIAANRAEFAATAAKIQADDRLNEEAKANDVRAAFEKADEHHRQLREQYENTITNHSASLWRQAFGPPSGGVLETKADKLARARLHSDALEKAANAKTETDLTRLLRSALIAGDASLAGAVGDAALRRGYLDIVDHYAKAYPDRVGAINGYLEWEGKHGLGRRESKLERALTLAGPNLRYQGRGGAHPLDGGQGR